MPYQDHFSGIPYAEGFRQMDGLLDTEPTATYRKLRDMWLMAEFRREESEALPSPWREFCLSSLEWANRRDLESLKLLHGASRISPRYFWMRYYVAEILLRRLNFYDLARAEIQAVVQACPWLWEARCLWTEILMAVGHKDPLKASRALTVPAQSRPAYLAWRGALELWSGEYALAVEDLNIAAGLDNPDALCWRGGALTKLGRLHEAKRDLDRLLTMDPHDPEGLVWRGEVHRGLGKIPEALQDLEAVIAISGDKPWAHVNRALIRLEQGKIVDAYRDFAQLYVHNGWLDAITHSPFPADELKRILEAALVAGRGCRRSDPHLNAAWMHAAGAIVPPVPTPYMRLKCWVRTLGIEAPDEIDATEITEAQVRLLLDAPPSA